MEVDRAVAFAVLAKVWGLFAGPVTLFLISIYLSPEMQGFYYTFLSLIALQSFVELGFSIVITQFASHEWANLEMDRERRIKGDLPALSRLISLGRLVLNGMPVHLLFSFCWSGQEDIFFLPSPRTQVFPGRVPGLF